MNGLLPKTGPFCGDAKLSRAQSIRHIVAKNRSVFRGDSITAAASKRRKERLDYYTKLVAERRQKRRDAIAVAKSKPSKKKTVGNKKRKRKRGKSNVKTNGKNEVAVDGRVDLVGRRVSMMGDVWYLDPNLVVIGKVTKREWYRGRKRERVDGYEVKWDDGVRENWPYESLLPCLLPNKDSDSSLSGIRSASRENISVDHVNKAMLSHEKIGVDQVDKGMADPEKEEYEGNYLTDTGSDSDGEIIPQNDGVQKN